VCRRVRIPAPQSLRVVRDDKKGTQCPGLNCATLFLGDINTRTCHSRLGEPSVFQSLPSRHTVRVIQASALTKLCINLLELHYGCYVKIR
jgi:hypothetical protein